MYKVKFILGEDKYVKILIHSPNNDPFEIDSASYELLRYGEVEDSGAALIDEHAIGMKLCPRERAVYNLTITYKVVDTTRKVQIQLEVV